MYRRDVVVMETEASSVRHLMRDFWRPSEGGEWAWSVGTWWGLKTGATGTRDTGRCCSWCRQGLHPLVPLSWSGRSGPVWVPSGPASVGWVLPRGRQPVGVRGWTVPRAQAAVEAHWGGWAPGSLRSRTCPPRPSPAVWNAKDRPWNVVKTLRSTRCCCL